MSQLPVSSPASGGFSVKQAQLAENSQPESLSEGDESDSLFNLALQISLEDSEGRFAGLNWTQQPSGNGDQSALTPILSGRVLPFQAALAGKGLPQPGEFSTQMAGSVSAGQFVTSLASETKPEFFMQNLLAREGRANIIEAMGRSESLLQFSDMADAKTGSTLFSVHGLQVPAGGGATRAGFAALSVGVPVGQPGWDREMGERIQWMVGRNIQNAEIKLTPPHLGPLEIRISVQNDQASVSFLAAQAPAREALEAAIPRLREMLGDANLDLVHVDVGGRESRDSQDTGQGGSPHGGVPGGGYAEGQDWREDIGVSIQQIGNGLVDDYA